jgi:hypothetical protein
MNRGFGEPRAQDIAPRSEMGINIEEFKEQRKAKSHECFLRRDVIVASRDLITL